ncbi:MAG: helix-turn-helix domain-containing protein [Thermoanaerobaculia bacterium]|nr:helix-turn-helix domain-containing protein [Thermoanaerobaculia bacterium]
MAADQSKEDQELLTLTELAEKADVSLPTAQKYKKNHQDKLPTVGKGRTQKYRPEAVQVVQEIYEENLARRGRGSKKSSGKKKSKKKKEERELLPLTEIAERAGVSYPTAQNYVKKHLDRIPHEGKGRRRKYPPEAVKAVQEIYNENMKKRGGGRKKKGKKSRSKAGPTSDRQITKALEKLEKRVASLEKLMAKPLKVEIKR